MRWLMLLATSAGCFEVSLGFTCHDRAQCVFLGQQGDCVDQVCVFATPDQATPDDLAGVDFSGSDFSQPPDLAGVDFSGADFSKPVEDLAGADLTPPNLACGTPQLLVTVENLDPGVGQVLRFQVQPYPSPMVPCAPLNGSGSLGRYPEAVTPFGAGMIAVAGRDQLSIVDTSQDAVTTFWPLEENSVFPLDVATVSHGGDSYLAVAEANLGDSYVSWLDVYKVGTSGNAGEWGYASLGLSSLVGVTVDTLDPTKLFIADNRATNPVYEEALDPWASSSWTTDRAPATSGNSVISIATVDTGGTGMTAWVTAIGVFLGYEYSGGSNLVGPIGCVCSSPLYAVPDPDVNVKAAFVLCDDSSANGRIVQRVRYDSIAPQCSTAFHGTTLPGNQRLTHLGYIYQ